MSLSVWDLIKYFYKWKWGIIGFTVFCLVFTNFYINEKQTYSSKVIIQYSDPCISNGKTLDGATFDPNEIKAPAVILNVLKDLGYENKKIDSVRENISISSITPTTVENLKASKEKLGEEYTYYPNTFVITYKGNSSFESTRDILSSVISNYCKYYSEMYLYGATLNEIDRDLNKKNFDYIEQTEQIHDNVTQTIEALTAYAKDSAGYRSPSTGMTFNDLLKEFERVNEYSVSQIFSKIYEGQVTKDKTLLINTYTERIESNRRDEEIYNYKADMAKDKMDAYVNANRNVPNAFNEENDSGSSANIIPGVEYDKDRDVDVQTTYDALIVNYSNDKITANSKKLEAEYCQSVIEKFLLPVEEGKDYGQYETEVKNEIENVLLTLDDLYKKANMNIDDYNAYLPALHIKKLSGVGYYENLSGSLYKVIALIGGFALSTVIAMAYEIIKNYSKFDIKNDEDDEKKEEKEAEATV